MEPTNNLCESPELQFTAPIHDPEIIHMDPSIPTATSGRTLQCNFTDEQLIDHLKSLGHRNKSDWPLGRYTRGWTDIVDRKALAHLSQRELHHFPSSNLEVFETDPEFSVLTAVTGGTSSAASDRNAAGSPSDFPSLLTALGIFNTLSPLKVWEVLKHVNPSGKSAGRITILQEPTPLMLSALHLSMRQNFDTNEVLRLLVGEKGGKMVGKSEARVLNRCYSPQLLHRRSFVFVFRYYTCVAENAEPPPWQYSNLRGPRFDHIDLAECRSVLALSLEGDAIKQPRHEQSTRTRRGTLNNPNHNSSGSIYDTFAPWHLLHIQSFPDDEHSCLTSIADGTTRFINGPYAFLFRLADEYRDAVKRNNMLHARITNPVIPPTAWLFDQHLRDKLLFEDNNLTYTRRYFWAFNALRSINQSIDSLVTTYRETFTDPIWNGLHPEIWPHPAPDSPQAKHYRSQLAPLRDSLSHSINELLVIQKKNEQTRQEIIILREQLLAGSSIKESRRSIERGDNMKMLTSISVIFLPLTFVTSVFGMTEFHIAPSEWQFPAIMVLVCVPVIVFVLLVQTVSGMGMVKRFVRDWLGFQGDREEDGRLAPYRYCVGEGWYRGSPRKFNFEERMREWVFRGFDLGGELEGGRRQQDEGGEGSDGVQGVWGSAESGDTSSGLDEGGEQTAGSGSKSWWCRWRVEKRTTSSGGGDIPDGSGNIA